MQDVVNGASVSAAVRPASKTGTCSCPIGACSRTSETPWTGFISRYNRGLFCMTDVCSCRQIESSCDSSSQGSLKEKTVENLEKYVVKDVSVRVVFAVGGQRGQRSSVVVNLVVDVVFVFSPPSQSFLSSSAA